ncbi:FAD-dependent oxidoreductase [Streptomyces sp. NPDC126499]|uniref:FAD-dependent oxidoreductase n=1 Tax=Streptomyces sp. NPDC126499 TaxID=3155314 RepID=UPI00332FFD9C
MNRTVDVLVVGGGPAGLAAAARLAAAGAGRVEVLEREEAAGGVPRHCGRAGFGAYTGPEYARRAVAEAVRAGAVVRTGAGATGWAGPLVDVLPVGPGQGAASGAGDGTAEDRRAGRRPAEDRTARHRPAEDRTARHRPAEDRTVGRRTAEDAVLGAGGPASSVGHPLALEVTAPTGLERITARAVVLATGARERPRSARLVPGSRPAGVLSTGELQQSVELFGLRGERIGRRAVVVGSEPVARHAVGTLRRAGVAVVAVVADRADGARLPCPVLRGATVLELVGRARLSGLVVRAADDRTRLLRCDTVVFTGDWLPDHELARSGGVPLDPATRGPSVDPALRTPVPGVFAAGNLLRGVEPAVVAAAEGRAVATAVLAHLAGAAWPEPGPALLAAGSLRWVTPGRLSACGASASVPTLSLRPSERLVHPTLTVTQDDRLLYRRRLPARLEPHRSLRHAAAWAAGADPAAGAVTVRMEADRTVSWAGR